MPKTVKVTWPSSEERVRYWREEKQKTLAKCDEKIAYHTERIASLLRQVATVELHLDAANADHVAKEMFYDSRIEAALQKRVIEMAVKKATPEQDGSQ